jgi:hypothetical protein
VQQLTNCQASVSRARNPSLLSSRFALNHSSRGGFGPRRSRPGDGSGVWATRSRRTIPSGQRMHPACPREANNQSRRRAVPIASPQASAVIPLRLRAAGAFHRSEA